MSSKLEHWRKLTQQLFEAESDYIMSDDEIADDDDELWNAQYQREEKIKRLIATAFKHAHIELDFHFDTPIYYDESEREAMVTLTEGSIEVDKLVALQQSSLADRYTVTITSGHLLQIVFNVRPELDQAI